MGHIGGQAERDMAGGTRWKAWGGCHGWGCRAGEHDAEHGLGAVGGTGRGTWPGVSALRRG